VHVIDGQIVDVGEEPRLHMNVARLSA
jgi:hypothetical protein